MAAADMDCEVPDDVVDEAIALFTADPSDRQALADISGLLSGQSRLSPFDAPDAGALGRPRFLRFSAPGGEIDVQIMVVEEGDGVSVSGQISARQPGTVVDWEISAHRTARAEAMGRTRASSGGLFQLRYDLPAAAVLRFSQCGLRIADCGLI